MLSGLRHFLKNSLAALRSRRVLFASLLVLPAVAVFLLVGLAPASGSRAGGVISPLGLFPQQQSAKAAEPVQCVYPDISVASFLELSPEVVAQCIRPELIAKDQNVLEKRFNPPSGFRRVQYPTGSFAHYLQSLPLKEYGEAPLYYDGGEKKSPTVAAVLDMRIGNVNLQQCADTVMRLRAEYLYARGEYARISFHFVTGFECSWDRWREGWRVEGPAETPRWALRAQPSDSEETFSAYLDKVYSLSSTLSLADFDMEMADPAGMQVGDAFVRPGKPGHAVIIVDMAVNPATNEKYIITAEGMIPAQQPQITNGLDLSTGPWIAVPYPLTGSFASSNTAFEWTQLMRFKDIAQD